MATQVILPALGMAQETGIIVRWLKNEGETVAKGEPLAEIETDKATVEIEAPATGVLANVTGTVGIEIPVGQVIAAILAPGESSQETSVAPRFIAGEESLPGPAFSPLAARIAAEHNLDLSSIKSAGRRIQRADVLAHIQDQQAPLSTTTSKARLTPASPKSLRLAAEQGKDLAAIQGT